MGAPQSAQQFFGAAPGGPAVSPGQLPTPEQFFAGSPQSGAAHDTVWSSIQTAGAHILNAMGQGVSDAWGARPLGLDQETESGLKKAGIFNDYEKGHESFVKSANEALIRTAASFADLTMRGPGALVGGAAAGAEEAQQQIQGEHPNAVQTAGGAAAGIAGELLRDVQAGAIPELAGMGLRGGIPEGAPTTTPEIARAANEAKRVSDAVTARAAGVVGEGEEGFYGAEPVSPENMQARTSAAQEAGLETAPPPLPLPPDVPTLARRIDPDTFEAFDRLSLERDQARTDLADLVAQRESTPEAIEAQGQITTILGRVNGVESRLTKVAAERLADAQSRLDTALQSDTPDMAAARSRVMEADFAMRDLAPQVSDAMRRAREMAPALPEVAEAPKGAETPERPAEAEERPPEAQEAELAAGAAEGGVEAIRPIPEQPERLAPVIEAGESATPTTEPPNVVGEERLGNEPAAPQRRLGGPLKEVEGTGPIRTRGLPEHVEAKAIEDGLTQTFGDLPAYRQVSMTDQARMAGDLIVKDPERAKAVAMGQRAAPKGLLPESVFVAVEKQALKDGDVDTLQELATGSRLGTQATTMGQRIRTLGERDKTSPVGLIQAVQQAREAALARKSDVLAAKSDVVSDIKDEIASTASGKDVWGDFIKGITCS